MGGNQGHDTIKKTGGRIWTPRSPTPSNPTSRPAPIAMPAVTGRGWNRTQGACRKGLSVKEVMGVIRDMIPSKKLGVGL